GIELMKPREAGPDLVVADAAVEQNRVPLGADQPRMYAGNQPVVFERIMIGNKPVQMPFDDLALQADDEFFRRQAGESEQFGDAGDADAADAPRRHCKIFRPPWAKPLSSPSRPRSISVDMPGAPSQ